MADVLIYSKNPLEDVAIVGDYDNNLKLIVKDGKVYKNSFEFDIGNAFTKYS